MGPDWKRFVDELIEYFSHPKNWKGWNGKEIAEIIKDREIKFLEKALKIMDEDEDDILRNIELELDLCLCLYGEDLRYQDENKDVGN